MIPSHRSLASVLFVFGCLSAQAGRPLTTEDAGVIDKGEVELEAYGYRVTEREAERISGWHVQPSVGVGFRTQIGLSFDTASQTGLRTRQWGLVGKTALKPLKDDGYGLALAYSVGKTRAPGERFRYDNAGTGLVLTVPRDKWLMHANLGWSRSQIERRAVTTWAVAAERLGALGPLDLAMEAYGNDVDPAWLGIAARWRVWDERLFIDASYAEQLSGTRAKSVSVGLKYAF